MFLFFVQLLFWYLLFLYKWSASCHQVAFKITFRDSLLRIIRWCIFIYKYTSSYHLQQKILLFHSLFSIATVVSTTGKVWIISTASQNLQRSTVQKRTRSSNEYFLKHEKSITAINHGWENSPCSKRKNFDIQFISYCLYK